MGQPRKPLDLVSSEGLGAVARTARGFELVEFADRYGTPCSLQASSLAEYEKPGTSAIWLGPNDATPKVLASQAQSLGVGTAERTGWVPYPIHPSVSLTTRMHLDREQVAALILHLQSWLDNDSFAAPNVRAKRATTVGRQARAGENVPRTTGPGLVACRWRSA